MEINCYKNVSKKVFFFGLQLMDVLYLVAFFALVFIISDSAALSFILSMIFYIILRKLKNRDKNYFFKLYLMFKTTPWLLIPQKKEKC